MSRDSRQQNRRLLVKDKRKHYKLGLRLEQTLCSDLNDIAMDLVKDSVRGLGARVARIFFN